MTDTCDECKDGTQPKGYVRKGRALFNCADCDRDISLAVLRIKEKALRNEDDHPFTYREVFLIALLVTELFAVVVLACLEYL